MTGQGRHRFDRSSLGLLRSAGRKALTVVFGLLAVLGIVLTQVSEAAAADVTTQRAAGIHAYDRGGARLHPSTAFARSAVVSVAALKAARRVADDAAARFLAAEDAVGTVGPRIAGQMGPRGWTSDAIKQTIRDGKQVRAINKATGNPATRYIHPETGQSVVVDDVTGEVIHVGGPGFKYGPDRGDVP